MRRCRAANLLRTLRQNRQAAALGLLETHKQRSGQVAPSWGCEAF